MGLRLSYAIDVALVISLLATFVTGVVKVPALGAVFRPSYEVTLIHDWGGLLFGILAIIHFLLHLRWYMSATRSLFGGKG